MLVIYVVNIVLFYNNETIWYNNLSNTLYENFITNELNEMLIILIHV